MSEVLIAERDTILEITLNRPDKGNALTPGMAHAMTAAIAGLGPEIRVVVIRANGDDFCTGRASAMPPAGSRATALDLRQAVSDPVLDFYQMLADIPVPVVAVVGGRAAGVGCAIVALADVAIAATSATFQVPEMNHDIAPTLVLNALIDRLSRAALARMVLTRDVIPASEAMVMGLVGIVTPDDGLEAEVTRVTGQLQKNSAPTVRAVKRFLAIAPQATPAARKELAALINCVAAAEKFR